MNRFGERGPLPARNKRLFKLDEYWYYKTREGIDVGPFDTYSAALNGISQFIDFILHAEPSVVRSIEKYSVNYQSVNTSINHHLRNRV